MDLKKRLNLKQEVFEFINHHSFHDNIDLKWFNHIALEIFHFQKNAHPTLARFWGDINPQNFQEVPAYPIEALKFSPLKLPETHEYFESSGTGTDLRSRNFFLDLDLYRIQVLKYYFQVFPKSKMVSLLKLRPHWSLAEMGKFVSSVSGEETVLWGTSKDLALSLEEKAFIKPDYIFDTGGFKNFLSPYSPEELYEKLSLSYHVPFERIISEYGMTELFSQSYDVTFEKNPALRKKKTVPTMTVSSRNSQLQFVDLCNVDSCAFLLTSDTGEVFNERTFRLQGRLENVNLRGCSL